MKSKKKSSLYDIERRICAYFDVCDTYNAEAKKTVKPYTLSGLLSFTGISRSEFFSMSDTRTRRKVFENAMARIEAFIEEKALTGELSCNASLNSLKYNFGWGERREGETEETKGYSVKLSKELSDIAR